MEVFDSYRRKRSAAGCGEGAGDGVDAQCGRRGFRSMAAIEKALELGLKDLTIYYDYMGIEMWAKDSGSAIKGYGGLLRVCALGGG